MFVKEISKVQIGFNYRRITGKPVELWTVKITSSAS